MKKLIFTLGVMLLICVCAVATTIEIEMPPLRYIINGEEVKMPEGESGFLYNDRTYVPIRFIAEALNKDVSWNDDTNTITISDKQPDCYELADGVLYKNGMRYDIKADGEVEYKKLYDNKLVYYIPKETEDFTLYEVYLYDFTALSVKRIDTAIKLVGDNRQTSCDYIFNYRSFKTIDEISMGFVNLKTNEVYHTRVGHQLCMFFDNETIYYSNVSDDGIYKEVLGQSPELLANINTIGAWIVKYNNLLICYNAEDEKGAVIDLDTNEIVSKKLTQREINAVKLNRMMFMYERNEDCLPKISNKKIFKNLEYDFVSDDGIIFKCDEQLFINENQKILLTNGDDTVELSLKKSQDRVILGIDSLDTEDKKAITDIIIKQF